MTRCLTGIEVNTLKRRVEALRSAPEVIPRTLKRAIAEGIEASSYVLMDIWFTQQPLIQAITHQGLDVVSMVKNTKQRYLYNGQYVDLKQLYRLAAPTGRKGGILRSIPTEMASGVEVKIVFVRNRNKKRDWLAILSTDGTLSDQEIIKIYGIRWYIEVFFKTTKSLLKLQKKFQTRS